MTYQGPVYVFPNVPEDVARERISAYRALYESCKGSRFVYDAAWAAAIALVEGFQWLTRQYQFTNKSGATVFRGARENYDPSDDQIRVSVNRTRDLTEEVASILSIDPEGWAGQFDPDPTDAERGFDDARIYQRAWRGFLRDHDVESEQRQSGNWRATCGTGLLKAVSDPTNPYKWDLVCAPLDRMIWDSANASPEISKHAKWVDCAAWTTDEIEARFPGFEFSEETKRTLPSVSELRAFDTTVQNIRGRVAPGAMESRTKGVLAAEFYDNEWGRLTIIMHSGLADKQIHVLWDGPNPYGACPFWKFDLGESLLGPWGIGVPNRIGPDQKVYNLAMTAIVRHLLTISAVRWLFEKNSIINPQSTLSPRVGAPIEWNPVRDDKTILPQMLQPPNMNEIAWNLVQMMPVLMQTKTHMSPVLQGQTPPRDSGQAIDLKLGQAGRVFADINKQDWGRGKRFLTHFVSRICDSAVTTPEGQARLVGDVGRDLSNALMQRLGEGRVVSTRVTVSIPWKAHQPRTGPEIRRDLKELASLGAIDAETMRYEFLSQTGQPVAVIEEIGRANALAENDRFRAGATADEIRPAFGEPGGVHLKAHGEFIANRYESGLPQEVVDEVQIHYGDTLDHMATEAGAQGAIAAEMQGNSMAMESLVGGEMMPKIRPTVAAGAMAAPQATPGQYGARGLKERATAKT